MRKIITIILVILATLLVIGSLNASASVTVQDIKAPELKMKGKAPNSNRLLNMANSSKTNSVVINL